MKKRMMVEIDSHAEVLIDSMCSAWGVKPKEVVQSAVCRGLAEMAKALTMQEERKAMDAERDARAAYTRKTGLPS